MTKGHAATQEKPAPHGRPWTPEEDKDLLAMHKAGMTDAGMGEVLGRSRNGVSNRLYLLKSRALQMQELGVSPLNGEKTRNCLGCNKPFRSAHSMNRFCPRCKPKEHNPLAPL